MTLTPACGRNCWAYNGHVNSTVIEAVEGERVRIYVTNRLPLATSVHWHGIYLPNGMDGVGGLTQPYIKPGETAKYEWTLRQYGTFMFHAHHDEMTQMGMGLIGMFIIHPRNPAPEYHVDRDFAIMLSEWAIKAGTARPNTLEMTDFNILTMNGKVFPSTGPLVCKTGDKVRIRLGNLGAMDHHPIHIHGYHFRITATDGEDIPLSAQWPETTVLVAVGQTRTIEFIADAPGDWAFHCHMTHHVMNQMGHEFPNMVGMKPGDLDEKVRPLLPSYMTMGHTGMDMGRMAEVMPMPANSIPMKGAVGPFGDYISHGRDVHHRQSPGSSGRATIRTPAGINTHRAPSRSRPAPRTWPGTGSTSMPRRPRPSPARRTPQRPSARVLMPCRPP